MRKYNHLVLLILALAISCSKSSNISPVNTSSTGVGGSTARFAIAGNHLYTVDNRNLNLFNISDPTQPLFVRKIDIGRGIETIFPLGNTLFVGSQFGMYIYDIATPASPSLLSTYTHVFSCDPVVADSNYAYVTLSSRSACGRNINQLEIVDIRNLKNPFLVRTYPMVEPKGLAIDNKKLFVCDDGLKIFDANDVSNLKLKNHFRIAANDVISLTGHLMVTGRDGIIQYQYDKDTISFLSNLPVNSSKF